MKRSTFTLRRLCEGAIFVALAQILGYVKLFELPQGGSITPAMLPLILFSCRWGFAPGVAAGTLFGLLQLVLDGAYAWGWISILFDYLFAFALVGFAGLCRRSRQSLLLGSFAGCFARFLSHFVSGIFFVAGTASFDIYSIHTESACLYSAIYNGSYMLPTALLSALLGLLLQKPLGRYLRREDLSA